MEIGNLIDGKWITVDLVKKSDKKVAVVITEGVMKPVEFDGKKSERLAIIVELNGNQLEWQPNKDSLMNMANAYGRETRLWVGKRVIFNTTVMNGRELVIGQPLLPHMEGMFK